MWGVASLSKSIGVLFCAAICLFSFATPALAKTIDLPACIRLAQPGESIETVISGPQNFDCTSHQNSFNPGTYWARFDISPSRDTTGKIMALRTASLWDEGLELAVVRADRSIEYYRPFSEKDISPMRLGGTIVARIERSDTPITAIYAKISNSAAMRGIIQQTQLSTGDEAIGYEMMLAVFYASFAGLSIALLVYNLAIWKGFRQRFLLAYCVMLVATLCYAVATSGAMHYIFPELNGAARLRWTIPLLTINAAGALIFMRYFFETDSVPRWLVRLTYGYCAALVGYATFYAVMLPSYVKFLDGIYVYSFVPIPVIAICYIGYAARARDPFLKYFLWAWSAPAIATIARIMFGLDLLPYHILIENSTLIGLACEALVSSLAIGRRVQLLVIARDRAESAEASAMKMADTDPLTGLSNRRSFVRKLMEEPRDWQLVLIDIDHFKRVNDTLGHVDGDDVLIRFAAIIKAFESKQSIVARLGGEEFAIATIAPADGSCLVDAEHLLQSIRKTPMPGNYRVTASIGIARRVICEERDWKVLYRAADMALYRAKATGRDRFVDYSAERIAA